MVAMINKNKIHTEQTLKLPLLNIYVPMVGQKEQTRTLTVELAFNANRIGICARNPTQRVG